MKTPIDTRLCEEARLYALRFACEDCAHFDAPGDACAHGYPTTPHRKGRLTAGGEIVFCKEFELGAGGDA